MDVHACMIRDDVKLSLSRLEQDWVKQYLNVHGQTGTHIYTLHEIECVRERMCKYVCVFMCMSSSMLGAIKLSNSNRPTFNNKSYIHAPHYQSQRLS